MTADEFKAWFHGFLEGIGEKTPTKAQFDKIRENVKDLRGSGVCTLPHYPAYPLYPRRWYEPWPWFTETTRTTGNVTSSTTDFTVEPWDHFYSLGKSDAEAE